MRAQLLDETVIVTAQEFSGDPLLGTVIGLSSRAIAIRLEAPLRLSEVEEARVLVASVRHSKSSPSEILSGQQVLCALTVVPTAKFDPKKPCDVSWWRGGGAAIGDVKLAP